MDTGMNAIKILGAAALFSVQILGEVLQLGVKTKVKETVTEKAFCWIATVFRSFI